jgi:hypothetical protein
MTKITGVHMDLAAVPGVAHHFVSASAAPTKAGNWLRLPGLQLRRTIFWLWNGAGCLWLTAMNLQSGYPSSWLP